MCVNLFHVFLAHTQPAQATFQRRLSLRRQFFSAGSACVSNFLAQAQHAQKKQNEEYLPQSSKKKIYPVLKSPTHTGFIGIKKGSKISHLGTFKLVLSWPGVWRDNVSIEGHHRPNNYKDTKPQMSSLLLFNRVYRLEIQSVMLVSSTPPPTQLNVQHARLFCKFLIKGAQA